MKLAHPNSGLYSDLEFNGSKAPNSSYHAMQELNSSHPEYCDPEQIANTDMPIPVQRQDHLNKRICRFRRRTFWLIISILILAVLVTGGSDIVHFYSKYKICPMLYRSPPLRCRLLPELDVIVGHLRFTAALVAGIHSINSYLRFTASLTSLNTP